MVLIYISGRRFVPVHAVRLPVSGSAVLLFFMLRAWVFVLVHAVRLQVLGNTVLSFFVLVPWVCDAMCHNTIVALTASLLDQGGLC